MRFFSILIFVAAVPALADRPNILLITVDTLRADRLGCYGYGLARTPAIDALAAAGVRCADATTTAPITMPAHASIMTGLLPPAHGVRDNGAYMLADEHRTLAEMMKDNGYRTAAFVSAVVLGRRYNLSQGFDTYDDQLWSEDEPRLFMIRDRPASRTADRALEWLQDWKANAGAPFFLWVHFFDPHQPYESQYRNRHLVPMAYDAEIAQADEGVARLTRWLEANGQLDSTITVFTADHGEGLGEHGEQTHAIFVYDTTIKVPLVVRYPALLPSSVYSGPVRNIDLFPTLRSMAGIADDTPVQGKNLLPALRGDVPPPELPQYAESLLSEAGFGMAPLYSVRAEGLKWIRAPKPELYNLNIDPRELTNTYVASDGNAVRMDAILQEILDKSKQFMRGKPANPLDNETLESLRALGYAASERERKAVEGMDPKDGLALYAKLEQARHAAQRAEYALSEKLLRELLDAAPGHVTARNVLGLVLMRQVRLDDAEHEYNASLKTDPAQARVHHMLGVIAVRGSDFEQAKRHCERALSNSPHLVESMVILGFVALQQNKQDEAETWYKRALEADPAMPRAHLAYADLYFLQGEFAKARTHYQHVLHATPNHFAALLQAGLCAQRMNEPASATSLFERAQLLRPDSWMPMYNLACVQALKGNIEEAVSFLARAGALAPPGARIDEVALRDEDFRAIREDKRFRSVLENLKNEPGR
ncbi:MAG: sulfatase-like hydrolase/transferase [Candidatus Hydrogenedentes bacterium]|nr:sulfatase-like hydrolase/transferase [Candidatus Hydrogenedentota bacterium]